MISMLSIIALGFFLGLRHATDPDHVIAVTTIVSRERRVWSGALVGALWGIGHTLTILVVGGAIILFKVVIPPRLGLSMEFSVALMLVVLGALSLTKILRPVVAAGLAARGNEGDRHTHPHPHADYVHDHWHGHGLTAHGHRDEATPQGWLDRAFGALGVYQILRPLIVGVIHGLAGSAAVALLVLTTIASPFGALAYLGVFGVGTIAGMMLVTAGIALPFTYTAGRGVSLNRHLATASGLLSLVFGLFLAYEVGVVGGLFTAYPQWTPE